MKPLTIAFKDLKQGFRSTFALAFMFAVPLLITGMFRLMFGGQDAQLDAAYTPSAAKVVVVNLDRGDARLEQTTPALMPDQQAASLGEMVVNAMQSPELANLMPVTLAADAQAAREQVDQKLADAAVIIPEYFSMRTIEGTGGSNIELYYDPSVTVASAVVKPVLGQIVDSISGARIAVDAVVDTDAADIDPAVVAVEITRQYLSNSTGEPSAQLKLHTPEQPDQTGEQTSVEANIIGPIMGGMMIFFAFFTAGSTAQSILKEDEQGTLARLFTTATRRSSILTGKYLAVGITLLVQVSILLIVSYLVFGIAWGTLAAVSLSAAGLIACASAFGIFLTSLMKNTRQGGAVYGGLMTVTGMLGMLTTFTGGGGASELIALLTPQGWAVRGLTLSMTGANLTQVALNALAMLGLSIIFMGIGVYKFQKRFA